MLLTSSVRAIGRIDLTDEVRSMLVCVVAMCAAQQCDVLKLPSEGLIMAADYHSHYPKSDIHKLMHRRKAAMLRPPIDHGDGCSNAWETQQQPKRPGIGSKRRREGTVVLLKCTTACRAFTPCLQCMHQCGRNPGGTFASEGPIEAFDCVQAYANEKIMTL
jgi:hypothetical protein